MGLIAKQKTKARTAAAQYPTSLSPDWERTGLPHMAAIVRAAVCAVSRRKKLTSSGFRGHDTLGIGSAMRSGESTIWFEQAGLDAWAIGLGLETVSGPALDWGIRLQVSRGSEVSVALSTPAVLTKDGAQVHKDEYLEVRELVVAGLTASAPPPPDYEVEACRHGLRTPPLPFASEPTTPYDGTYAIATALEATRAAECLQVLPFAPVDAGPSDGRWRIGLSTAADPSWVVLTVNDLGASRELEFNIHLTRNAHTVTNLVATQHARAFASCALRALQEQDAGASISAAAPGAR